MSSRRSRRVAAETGTRTFISLNQNKRGGYHKVLDRIASAAGRGLPMQAQVAVRPIGVLFGVDTTLDPFLLNPEWARYKRGDREERLAALSDLDVRARIIEEPPPNLPMCSGATTASIHWAIRPTTNRGPSPASRRSPSESAATRSRCSAT